MTLYNNICCVCSYGVQTSANLSDDNWLADSRIVYAFHDTPPFLSGLGRLRANGEGFELLRARRDAPEDRSRAESAQLLAHPIKLMPQALERCAAYGYPFHDACWTVFSASAPAGGPDLRTLFNICRSLPIHDRMLQWGHNYGGMFMTEPGFAPGDEPRLKSGHVFGYKSVSPGTNDMLDLAVRRPTVPPTSDHPVSFSSRLLKAGEMDVFRKIPLEIRALILCHLPSEDVANLRLASPIYAVLPLPELFWKSRFLAGCFFHHIFEVDQIWNAEGQSWRDIFHSVKEALTARPKSLITFFASRHRRRIWDTCLSVHRLISTVAGVGCDGVRLHSFLEPEAPRENRHWETAGQALKAPEQIMDCGSRVLHERMIKVPDAASTIAVSMIDMFGTRYISGIKIANEQGEACSIGYMHQDTETLDLRSDGVHHRLTGFRLAHGIRGVQGLSVIHDDEKVSAWLGEHHDLPQRRLVTSSEETLTVDYIKCSFDALKLVSISIPSLKTTLHDETQPLSPRDALIWYPQIPHRTLEFLDSPRLVPSVDEFQGLPISFQIFGGLRGEHAHCLINFRAVIQSPQTDANPFVSNISLDFEGLPGAAELGATSRYPRPDFVPGEPYLPSHHLDLPIDGPGGERIIGIDAFYDREGMMRGGFIIHTSANRQECFPNARVMRDPNLEIRRSRAGDDTVVGFWAIASTRRGLCALGLVVVKK